MLGMLRYDQKVVTDILCRNRYTYQIVQIDLAQNPDHFSLNILWVYLEILS